MRNSKGFTLIELLLVVAIIALITSIVWVSLATSRNRARDAAIKTVMSQIRNVGDLFFSNQNPNTYIGLGGSAGDMASIKADIVKNGGTALVEHYAVDKYCIQYNLNVSGAWCVDSENYRGNIAFCDNVNYDCAVDP